MKKIPKPSKTPFGIHIFLAPNPWPLLPSGILHKADGTQLKFFRTLRLAHLPEPKACLNVTNQFIQLAREIDWRKPVWFGNVFDASLPMLVERSQCVS
jgi:hypothetical protein